AIALRGEGEDCQISHNEIHTTPYSAVNCGGERMIIENNLIYDMMKELNDGGAIYCFSPIDLVLRGNIVRGSSGTRAHAYYLDEQAENCVVEKNLAIDTAWPSHNHMTKNCFIRNNVFIDSGTQLLTFPRSIGMTFEKNILIADEITFRIPVDGDIDSIMGWEYDGLSAMPNNILFSRSNRVALEERSQNGNIKSSPLEPREGTIYTDPMFADSESGDFAFKPGSPALKLGIEQIDVSRAGRTGSRW
ncbi:unnamed protein product, partial [marine sediment metagenome]